MVYDEKYNHKSGDAAIKVDIKKELPNGLYHLKMSDGTAQFSGSVIISN